MEADLPQGVFLHSTQQLPLSQGNKSAPSRMDPVVKGWSEISSMCVYLSSHNASLYITSLYQLNQPYGNTAHIILWKFWKYYYQDICT